MASAHHSWSLGADDDDDDWQEMPVIRSDAPDLDEEDRLKYRYVSKTVRDTTSSATDPDAAAYSNATGTLMDLSDAAAAKGEDWREKGGGVQEADYTRLGLDDDPEEDNLHMRTQYLFDDDKGMTPLSQMQATKNLLSEGQRIAYVGLCRLVMKEMVLGLKKGGHKEMDGAVESMTNWATKIMARLYQHMELEPSEQKMIEQLSDHGVTAIDLVPSLMTTHTVPNPGYDPDAAAEALAEEEKQALEDEAEKNREEEEAERERKRVEEVEAVGGGKGAWEEELEGKPKEKGKVTSVGDEQEGSRASTPPPPPPYHPSSTSSPPKDTKPTSPITPTTPTNNPTTPTNDPSTPASPPNLIAPLPSTLPGVSTTLTSADATVTLDIRWTILCDLFLAVIADSVYDARSRVLLGRCAHRLGLSWMDVVRFERRLTEALEVQEGISVAEHGGVIQDRAKKDKTRRYMMMGAAAVGGGLVIGLSAGLLAPVIGAGLAAGFTTIGVTGTSGFLAGTAGAAVITTAGTVTGMNIGGKGMARRTQSVRTFNILPLHNNKRVNVFLTMPGFMAGVNDDVRLPFSVMDQAMGDVLSVLWEPEMMGETGNILKILTSEVLTQVGQQVLQATVLTALMSALQWPVMLTKLGYLIDNPWSNALDRAKSAGAVLADVLINRHVGVRPVSLIGFSLGARAIFYALMELAKRKAYGVVQEVYLLGATVTASNKVWRDVRGVVAGRFVNGYCKKDWILGYLYRASTGGLQTVAGLSPVENVPDMENVDLTDILVGHMSYRVQMPVLLQKFGFRVTADHFDEPDEMEEDGDGKAKTKVEETLEEVKDLEKKKRTSFFGGLTKGRKSSGGPPGSGKGSMEQTKEAIVEEDDEDDPPREELPHRPTAGTDSPASPHPVIHLPTAEKSSSPTSPAYVDADAGLPPTTSSEPNTFDIAAIRAEIAKVVPRRSEDSGPRSGGLEPVSGEGEHARVSSAPGSVMGASPDSNEDLRRKWLGGRGQSSTTVAPPAIALEEGAWGVSNSTLPTPIADDVDVPSTSTSVYHDATDFGNTETDSSRVFDPFSFASPYGSGSGATNGSSISFGGRDGDLAGEAWQRNNESSATVFRSDPWKS